jgi:hypothetical protein
MRRISVYSSQLKMGNMSTLLQKEILHEKWLRKDCNPLTPFRK